MAGLCAAAHATEQGASVLVLEKGDRAGGSMLLSSGVVWRYRDFARFREECPTGNEQLQRTVHEGVDDGLEWLISLGAPVVLPDTGNPDTHGFRFDTRGMTDSLVRAGGELRVNEPLRSLPDDTPVILATGGFQGDRELVRRYITPEVDDVTLRSNPWSTGDGLRFGLEAGADLTPGMDEFWGRNMPAPPAQLDSRGFVPLGQLYARFAKVENVRGERYEARTWSEIDVTQWTAKQPQARAWYHVADEMLGQHVRDHTVGELIEAARLAGGPVKRTNGTTTVEVVAGMTTTIGGLSVGPDCRIVDGLYACGADIGGISTGGYSSGLAAALVLGRLAAEAALSGRAG